MPIAISVIFWTPMQCYCLHFRFNFEVKKCSRLLYALLGRASSEDTVLIFFYGDYVYAAGP